MDQSQIINDLRVHLNEAQRLLSQIVIAGAPIPNPPFGNPTPIVIGSTPPLISNGAQKLGIKIAPIANLDPTKPVYVVTHIFTVLNGTWSDTGNIYDSPQWAIEQFYPHDEAGADHHLFGKVIGKDGKPKSCQIKFWTPNYHGNEASETSKSSGWVNFSLGESSSFNPDVGARGEWAWQPQLAQAEMVTGGGLPNNWHVSTYVVWREI